MATEIKAIPTRYKGYHFRSRLEARWAVFFDAMGLKWEYEPEGFQMGKMMYLPDFRVWTPQGEPIWYEVKPDNAKRDRKIQRFKNRLEECALLNQESPGGYRHPRATTLTGDPLFMLFEKRWGGLSYDSRHGTMQRHRVCPRCSFIEHEDDLLDDGSDIEIMCFSCDWETPQGGGHEPEAGVAGVAVMPHKGWLLLTWKQWRVFTVRVYKAAESARSARFEHGQSGAT